MSEQDITTFIQHILNNRIEGQNVIEYGDISITIKIKRRGLLGALAKKLANLTTNRR